MLGILLLATLISPTAAADRCGGAEDQVADFGGTRLAVYRNCNHGQGRTAITFEDPLVGLPDMQMQERAISGVRLVVRGGDAVLWVPAIGIKVNDERVGMEKLPDLGCIASADRNGRHYRICHFLIQ